MIEQYGQFSWVLTHPRNYIVMCVMCLIDSAMELKLTFKERLHTVNKLFYECFITTKYKYVYVNIFMCYNETQST